MKPTVSPRSTLVSDDGHELSAAEQLRAKDRQIEMLMAALERQSRMMEMVMMGGVGRAMPVAAPTPPPAPAAVAAVEAPEPAPVDTLTMAEAWPRYLASLGTASWVRNAELLAGRMLRWFAPSVVAKKFHSRRYRHVTMRGPDMLISAMRPHHWMAFRDHLRATDREIGVTTRNHMLARAMAFMNWLVLNNIIPANPFTGVKTEPKKPRRETTLTPEQLEQMLLVEPNPMFHAFMLSASDSGMRNSEVRTLKWDQIDFGTGRVKLSWTETKSRRSRVVRLSPRAMDALRLLPRTSQYVFASERREGRPISPAAIWVWFRRAAAAVGVVAAPGDGRITFHDATRHTFASRMHKAGATIKEIQVALGHSSLATTAIYIHTDEEALDRAHALLHGAARKGPAKNKPTDDK